MNSITLHRVWRGQTGMSVVLALVVLCGVLMCRGSLERHPGTGSDVLTQQPDQYQAWLGCHRGRSDPRRTHCLCRCGLQAV